MSFKFYNGTKAFWAKEVRGGRTEVYYLEVPGLSEKVADLSVEFDHRDGEGLMAHVRGQIDTSLVRAQNLFKR